MRKRRATGMRTKRLRTLIKRTVMKKAEPKLHTYNVGKVELYHNSFYSPLGVPPSGLVHHMNRFEAMPSQGTADDNRVGDQINGSGFKLKILIGQKADRPNVTFRWLVLKVPKGSAITYANWFNLNTNNSLLDDPNTDFVKVVKQGIWRPNEAGLANVGGDEYTFVHRLWIPYKKLIKFGPAPGARTHNDDDLYFVVMAYDAFGSLQTDNIAYIQVGQDFHYRDP